MIESSLISVIVPCYNQGVYLNDALKSVLEQSHSNWECIIINDGATDDTEKIAHEWQKNDQRFKYFYKNNGGLSSARNMGLEMATGRFIQFLDADDHIAPGKFTTSLQHSKEAQVIISGFQLFNQQKYFSAPFELKKEHFNFHSILCGWDDLFVIPIHCALFTKDLFKTFRFSECLKAREDWVMWIQLYLLHPTTVFIDQPLAFYRTYAGGMSQHKVLMDTSLVEAYKQIYQLVPPEFHQLVFDQAMNKLGKLLNNAQSRERMTRESRSYVLGNFFVRNFNRLTNRPR